MDGSPVNGGLSYAAGVDAESAVVDDTILPTQLPRQTVLSGEKRLLMAILMLAIEHAEHGCPNSSATKPSGQRRKVVSPSLQQEARQWILSCQRTPFNSFENICDVLDLEAEAVRVALRRRWK